MNKFCGVSLAARDRSFLKRITLAAMAVIVVVYVSRTQFPSGDSHPQSAQPSQGFKSYTQTLLEEVKRDKIMKKCSDKFKECSRWAADGKCHVEHMKLHCARSCNTCAYATSSYDVRCMQAFLNETNHSPIKDGELHHIIRKTASLSKWGAHLVNQDPPVVVFDHFLNASEVGVLVSLGFQSGFRRSKNAVQDSSLDKDGVMEKSAKSMAVSDIRTSQTAWCSVEPCVHNSTVLEVRRRMSEITTVPEENFEFLQMLRYEPKQFYRLHHDFIPDQSQTPCGANCWATYPCRMLVSPCWANWACWAILW